MESIYLYSKLEAATVATEAGIVSSATTVGTEQVLSAPSTTSSPPDDYNDIFYEDYIDFYGGGDQDVEEDDEMVDVNESTDGEKREKEGLFSSRQTRVCQHTLGYFCKLKGLS